MGSSASTLAMGLVEVLGDAVDALQTAPRVDIRSAVALLARLISVLFDARVLAAGLAAGLAMRIVRVRADLARVGSFPGLRVAMNPLFPYPLVPRLPYVCMDAQWWNRLKHEREWAI